MSCVHTKAENYKYMQKRLLQAIYIIILYIYLAFENTFISLHEKEFYFEDMSFILMKFTQILHSMKVIEPLLDRSTNMRRGN